MGILSFLHPDVLQPEWIYTVRGVLWRILFAEEDRIVGECRDHERKTTTFFCLDLLSGRALWQELALEEPWWVGLEAVQENIVLLHTYASPDMPQHKGIRAYDREAGKLRWRSDELVYWFPGRGRVFAYRDFFEKRVAYELDLQTGKVLRTFEDSVSELQDLRRDLRQQVAPAEVVLPERLESGALEPAVNTLVERELRGKKRIGDIEFIRDPACLMFSCHVESHDSTRDHPLYENHFFVYRMSDGRRLFSEVLGRNLKTFVPDMFFVRNPYLLFVKDQHTLTALRPWKS